MFNIFKSKPSPIIVAGLGEFTYSKTGTDEYWELTSKLRDPANAIDIDFCAIEGTHSGPFEQAKDVVIELFSNPQKLWAHVDHKFVSSAKEDVRDITEATMMDYFFIKTLTVKDSSSYEIGLHCKSKDVFVELFIRNGSVTEVHKDYDCCSA